MEGLRWFSRKPGAGRLQTKLRSRGPPERKRRRAGEALPQKATVNMDSGIKKSFRHKRFLLLAAAAVGVVVVVAFFWKQKAAAYTYFTAPVQRGPIRNVVNATGTVQAVLTVQVGIQITGQIEALYADYNSIVKPGQLLAKIDPRNFQAQAE